MNAILARIYRRLDGSAVQQFGRLARQFLDRLLAGAGYRLVGTDINPFNTCGIMQGLQCHQHLNGGAVRVRNDAMCPVGGDCMGIDLRHDQRNVVVITKPGGIVDHDTTGLRRKWRVSIRYAGTCGEESDLHSGKIKAAQVLHGKVGVPERDLLTGRTLARQRVDPVHGKFPFRQDLQHGFTHGTGSADNCNIVFT